MITDDTTGARIASLGAVAAVGTLTAPLAAGGIYLWDDLHAVELTLSSGHLSSRDDAEVLAGANRIAVETDGGNWEIVGFANAALTGPGAYRLTRLLRGQGGSDFAIGACAAGNSVLVLDARATLLTVPGSWLDASAELRSFAGSADPTGQLTAVAIGLKPALPLKPVHLSAARGASNDIALSWVRRSRADTDSWAAEDAPLDCSPEAYRVTIFNGVTAVRTIDVGVPSATYSAAQQTADFGSPPSSFAYTVAQKSPLYGAGHAATATFTA